MELKKSNARANDNFRVGFPKLDELNVAVEPGTMAESSKVGRSGELTENSILESDVWRMIFRLAEAAGIKTGITTYLKTGAKSRSRSRWTAPVEQHIRLATMPPLHDLPVQFYKSPALAERHDRLSRC